MDDREVKFYFDMKRKPTGPENIRKYTIGLGQGFILGWG